MDVPILVCGCGMRVRAPGARPGRVGRCPACGGRMEVPDLSGIPDDFGRPAGTGPGPVAVEDPGFGPIREIAMTPARARAGPAGTDRGRSRRRRGEAAGLAGQAPMSDGVLEIQREAETGWAISFLYPLRGAESLAMVGAVGAIAWIFAVLVPEYCLQAMADTEKMGASLLGILFVGLAILPVAFLGPLVLAYWLQYLGRVLVSGAMGECAPPRMPDRNFEGFLHGLSAWVLWLALGLGVGLAPASWWAFSGGRSEAILSWPAWILAAAGMPYVLAALLLCFLHEDALAAMPWGVIRGLWRLGPRFLLLAGLIAAALGLVGGGLALLLWVRARLFWPYLLMALGWWVGFLWVQVVVMRLLGVFYFHRKDELGWNRAHPRWGVAWRL